MVDGLLAENAAMEAVRARRRARRGAGASGRQAAAARADGPRARLDVDDRHARLQLLRELFGLDERGRRPRRSKAAEVRRLPRVTPLRLGTRGSALALAQAREVARCSAGTSSSCGSRPRATSTARAATSRAGSARRGGAAVGEIDLAVHSAKDVPGKIADGHGDRRDAPPRPSRSTCWSVRRPRARARRRAGRDERAAPARAAAGRAARTSRSWSCAGTSTRGWPSAPRARSTR